ncbi:MAG: SDR family oxidoreductase [Sedimentisphaerales bacterium]|jgi:NAD(P)-dependent dehydrogenase (short-subunit alcohol dehydrogenase family)
MTQTRRTYLITGAANRIGRGLAGGLVRQDDAIVIHYNSSESAAKQLSKEISNTGVKTFIIGADLGSANQCEKLMHRVWDLAGPIDVLINNASIFEEGQLAEITIDDINRNMMINAYAPLLLSRSFAELNKTRKPDKLPVIINMLDSRITDYDRLHAAYAIAKRTLFTLTKMMALEFALAVRVNGIAPGLILPPRGKDLSYLEQLKSSNPLNAIGTIEQIVAVVRFLIDNEFITGQVIFVDGGRNLLSNTYG